MTKTCLVCGTDIIRTQFQRDYNYATIKYCSDECRDAKIRAVEILKWSKLKGFDIGRLFEIVKKEKEELQNMNII